MSEVHVLSEPRLEFRFGQESVDPHTGLALFGPFDSDMPSHPGSINYGVIGTSEGIERFHAFASELCGPIVPEKREFDHDLWPPFPGFDVAFSCDWPSEPAWKAVVDKDELIRISRYGDPHHRAFGVVQHYLERIAVVSKRDERLSLIFCVVPEEVFQYCRPVSSVPKSRRTREPLSPKTRTLISKGQQDMFDPRAVERFRYSVDFRRQLKARSMEFAIPLQLIRETALRLTDRNANPNERDLTPLADRAWNICTTAYYKAGGKPWKLTSARRGVCYIGLAFRKASDSRKGKTAVCAAQMFLESGDGVVFKGETGPWYSPEKKAFHLSGSAAEELLRGVIATYKSLGGLPLSEVFLHSRSAISREEFDGYRSAVEDGTKVVAVRVRSEGSNGLKLYRPGRRPVMRGTFWPLGPRRALLWGSGFVPRLQEYPGSWVPVPLNIDIQHGEADLRAVGNDILALTKLNYNACSVGDSQPVTVGFSDKVGEILVANPDIEVPHPQFRYYI